MRSQVLVHSTAEFLAKRDEYSAPSLDFYMKLASEYHAGLPVQLDAELVELIRLHELMLADDEAMALRLYPDLADKFNHANQRQVEATRGEMNLDYFIRHGVEYSFDEAQADRVAALVDPDKPLTVALMRQNIVSASGYENVRLNYIYHDVMDHVWLFDFMRRQRLDEKYRDFLESVGGPFSGNLMSRESELISGIGFTSRRYLSDPGYYGRMGIGADELVDFLSTEGDLQDERIQEAMDIISTDAAIAEWAGFVVKDTIANIVTQRGKRGAVKKLVRDTAGNYVSTYEPAPLLDPVYVALIIETVARLADNKPEYIEATIKLNLILEEILNSYVSTGRAVGQISLSHSVDLEAIPENRRQVLMTDIGLSTSYFEK